MSETVNLEWAPPGPVAGRFMRSPVRVPVINGPIGSGKTTACFVKAQRWASKQQIATRVQPATQAANRLRVPVLTRIGGLEYPTRLFKLCVVRDTYRQLWKTTLATWFKRFPKESGDFQGAVDGPASHAHLFALADGSLVDMRVDFTAIGDNAAEDVLRGYEPTAFYLNEADLLAEDVFTYADGRIGRYPDMALGGPSWVGVIMDCNAPELNSWLYDKFFRATPEALAANSWALFRQPSGLAPEAENLMNLRAGYYEEQARGKPAWYVARMLENRPGFSRAGKPVYPDFNDTHHVAEVDLRFTPGLKLHVGLDAGLSPAAVFGQRMPNGQWRILDELIAEAGTGATRFGRDLARVLHDRFPEARDIEAWADPSAAYGADKAAGEQSWIEIVEAIAKIRVRPAPTNALIPRLEAVRVPLTRFEDGAFMFRLSPRCAVLREGFNSAYHYRRQLTPDERYAEVPEKNRASHPHDALQYLMGAAGEDAEIRHRGAAHMRARTERQHVHEWDPLNTQEVA